VPGAAATSAISSMMVPSRPESGYCMNSISLSLEPDDAERDGVVD
jgi:peptide methionine sulfoxide reductase MsrB